VRKIPFWIKACFTGFVFLLAHSSCKYFTVADLCSFSSLAVIATLAALWLESSLLASMAASAMLLDIVWSIDLAGQLLLGSQLLGLSSYLDDDSIPGLVRMLFLHHLWLPPFQLWLIYRLKYDTQAWAVQTMIGWCLLLGCYFLTDPQRNINWVFGPGSPQSSVPGELYLFACLGAWSMGIFLPTHLVLMRVMKEQMRPASTRRDTQQANLATKEA